MAELVHENWLLLVAALAGAGGAKGAADPAVAEQLLGKIEEISKIFWETKQA